MRKTHHHFFKNAKHPLLRVGAAAGATSYSSWEEGLESVTGLESITAFVDYLCVLVGCAYIPAVLQMQL